MVDCALNSKPTRQSASARVGTTSETPRRILIPASRSLRLHSKKWDETHRMKSREV